MPDRYSVENYTLPYGSVGGAGAKAMQAELLRRLAMKDEAEKEALRRQEVELSRQRQARIDADAMKTSDVNRRVAEGNLASNEEVRAAMVAEREQKTKDAKVKAFLGTLKPGKATKEQRAQAEALGQSHLFAQKDVVGPDTEEDIQVQTLLGPEDVGPQSPPEVRKVKKPGQPTGEKEDMFLGTPEQQKQTEEKAERDAVLAGKYKQDPRYGKDGLFTRIADNLEANALLENMGIDKQMAAQILAAPKAESFSASERDAQLETILAKPENERTPQERSLIKGRKELLELKGEPSMNRLYISSDLAGGRQQRGFDQQNRTNLITNVENDQKVYQNQAEASIKGINLLDKGGTADMAAVSQFLTATSGGFGSGQRINDTELNAVLESRPLWDSWTIEAQRLTSVGKTINKLTPAQRAQMKSMLQIALKDAAVAIDQNIKTVADAGDAPLAAHWRKTLERVSTKIGMPTSAASGTEATGAAPFKVTINPPKSK